MQERAKITRAKILDTAIRIFSEFGFYGTRVDAVAAEAGVNKQRIYAYYGSKNSLFEAALTHVFDEVSLFSESTLKQAAKEPEKLTEMLLADFMGLHDKYPYFWRMLSWANLNEDVSTESLLNIRAEQDQNINGIFEKAKALGHIKKDLSFTAYIFNLMSISFFYHANRKTLSKTFSADIYTPAGRKALMRELVSLF
jgi:TetR/AcrR family transcriptional regulator